MRDLIARLTVEYSDDGEPGGRLSEAPRKRRTAYRSGRRELLGATPKPPTIETSRKKKRRPSENGSLQRTPFSGKFRWKKG